MSHDDALVMIDYMTGTAGAVISWIRAKGTDGYFGELGPQVADQLRVAFAQSAGVALWAAALFLALGLAGALAVERASRRVANAGSGDGTLSAGWSARRGGGPRRDCAPPPTGARRGR